MTLDGIEIWVKATNGAESNLRVYGSELNRSVPKEYDLLYEILLKTSKSGRSKISIQFDKPGILKGAQIFEVIEQTGVFEVISDSSVPPNYDGLLR